MKNRRTGWIGVAAVLVVAAQAWAAGAFEVKANDVWVMAGDSITAQRLHSNYIEAFFRTRMPDAGLKFRNSGIGGNRTGHVLGRFEYDVAAFKPTIVSVELGMNDVGAGDDPQAYVDGMRRIVEKIRAIKATPLLISSSPVNDGSVMDQWMSDRCRRIHPYTEALKKLGEELNVTVVDQYHPLLGLWGRNRPAEELLAIAARVEHLTRDPNLPGVAELKAFAKVWQESGYKPVVLGGDPVHPGPVGQYTMAATILSALNVDREVSAATLKADGTVAAQERCKITDVSVKEGVLAFTRLDERRPWPIALHARDCLRLMPEMADLSRYMLTVTGLPEGEYEVVTQGAVAAKATAAELAAGHNLSTVTAGVIAERGEQILDLIAALQGPLNTAWRAASKAGDAAKLQDAEKALVEHEAKVAAACRPEAIRFEIRPAKAR